MVTENPILYDLARVQAGRRRSHERKRQKALFDQVRFVPEGQYESRGRGSERSNSSESLEYASPSSVAWSPPPTPEVLYRFHSRNQLSPNFDVRCHAIKCLSPSPQPFDHEETVFSVEPKDYKPTQVAELPGSLLLPSQGFVQSDPPILPLRPQRYREGSERLLPAAAILGDTLLAPSIVHSELTAISSEDRQILEPIMQDHRQQCLPPRTRTPLSTRNGPSEAPPPVPLSQMTIEELMYILPSLDAAVIAVNWVPCMQKRQKELKAWLQKNKADPAAAESLRSLDQNLSDVFDRSVDVAQTYHQLFDIAKKLQDRDDKKKDSEIYEATAQKSEALIALSRQISLQEELATQHEREMDAYKDKTHQAFGVLRSFIKKHLYDAMQHTNSTEMQELLDALVEVENPDNFPPKYIRVDIYHSLADTLSRTQEERDNLREVCTDQMKTIRQQSQDLDDYLDRTQKVVDSWKLKEHENKKLKADLATARALHQTQKMQSPKQQIPTVQVTEPQTVRLPQKTVLEDDFDEEMWAKDAEITNLRRKLDKSTTRERALQDQVRQLVQDSNMEPSAIDKPPSRLKRLLGSQQKSSPGIPTMNSMHNLSSTIFTPFLKEKSNATTAISPPKSGRISPVLAGLCDTTTMDHLELPGAHHAFRSRTRDISPQPFPPRLRETASHDEIDDAVSSRFHQMPLHMRSTASTPTSSGQSSYVEVPEHTSRSRTRLEHEPSLTRSEMSFGQLAPEPQFEGRQALAERHNRVLSGITEVTEESAPDRRQSAATGSPDSVDRLVYLESIDAERTLGQRY